MWRPPEPADGRWQRGINVAATYFADEPETAWAEWYRALAEAGIPPNRSLPRDLWRAEINLEVADLSDPNRLQAVGLDKPRPGRVEWPAYQAVGERLHKADWAGLVTPSAARHDHLVLCVFRTQHQMDGVAFLHPPQRIDDPPIPPQGMST